MWGWGSVVAGGWWAGGGGVEAWWTGGSCAYCSEWAGGRVGGFGEDERVLGEGGGEAEEKVVVVEAEGGWHWVD